MEHWPTSFGDLLKFTIEDYSLSDRIIDSEIIISRVKGKIKASLVGVRVVRGGRNILFGPSNKHAWVIDGRIIRPLPRDAVEIFEDIFSGHNPDDLNFLTAVRLAQSEEMALPIVTSEGFYEAATIQSQSFDNTMAVPGLNATLYPYQAQGVQWMKQTLSNTPGLILADEMGLGKTIQIISLLLCEVPVKTKPALVLCPTSLLANWEREIKQFAPSLSVNVHRGPNRTGVFKGLQKSNIVITTYETMVNDIAIFSAFKWAYVICDEAQAIKNPDSNRRKAVVTIPRDKTIPISGTPVENSLLDLWSLVDFAAPNFLGNRSEFEIKFPDSLASAEQLGNLTQSIILNRRVADVAGDLPPRIEIDLPLELDEPLIEYYREVREETLSRYPVAGALVATLQLQLVCAHPWLIRTRHDDLDGELAEINEASTFPLLTPKIKSVVRLLREAFFNSQKVIIFSSFNRMNEIIRKATKGLPNAHWGAINGSTDPKVRQIIIDEFSRFEGPACLVLNPKAAGAGLNITAATIVIHLTPLWNPALEAQASARAHRRGQARPVTIYRLYYENTVERVMIDRSAWKSMLGNEIIPISTRDSEDLNRALSIQPEIQ